MEVREFSVLWSVLHTLAVRVDVTTVCAFLATVFVGVPRSRIIVGLPGVLSSPCIWPSVCL